MDEYIKKQDIYDELSKDYDYLTNYGKGYVDATIRMIKAIPAADVVEVRHGEWRILDRTEYGVEAKCSNCGYSAIFGRVDIGRFCPNCGAKMDGKGDK